MEPISEAIEQKRTVDATLARFSAVHDELVAEEKEKRSRRRRFRPWRSAGDEMDEALSSQYMTPVARPAAAKTAAKKPQASEDESAESAQPEKLNIKRRYVRSAFAAKALSTAAALALLALTGVAWSSTTRVNRQIQEVAALDESSAAIQDGAKQNGDENFLLLGTNSRAGTAAKNLATDPIMVAHVPADRSRLVVVSFPGSLLVSQPACQGWNNKSSQYTADQSPAKDGVRLDSVYQLGGPRCLTDTVQDLTGLRINHFVGLDPQGFKDMVGAAQGVTLCVRAPMTDSQLGSIISQSGPITLAGDQALDYLQADHVAGDPTGEYGRITRQQLFLAAMLREMMSKNVLVDPSKLNGFLNTFTKSTFGDNMGVDQLLKLAQSLQSLDLHRVTFITVPTTGTADAAGNLTLDANLTTQLFNSIISDSPLPGENPEQAGNQANGSSATVLDPKSVKIQVFNGGDVTANAAGNAAQALRQQGFQVMQVQNGSGVPNTVIKYSADQRAQALTLRAAVPSATLQVDPTLDGAIELIIGPTFDGTVQAPHPGSPLPSVSSTNNQLQGLSMVNAADTSCH